MTYLFPDLLPADYPRLAERYRFHYLAGDHKVTLFDGADDGIQAFRDAGFSSRGGHRQESSRSRSRAQGFRRGVFFHASRCADEGFPKPHPDMLLYLMDTLGVDARAHADDRRHDPRSGDGAQRRRSRRWRLVMVRIRASASRHKSRLPVLLSFAELTRWVRQNA